jgi:urease accessory protein UreH
MEFNPERLGLAEGYNYMATLAVVAGDWEGWRETLAAMEAELRNMPEVYGGGSVLASDGCVVKLLARSASDLTRAQTALWGRARQIVLGSPAIDLRKY